MGEMRFVTAEPKYLTVQAAAEALRTNRRRIWQMIRDKELEAIDNPLDRREKLIPRAEVERLSDFAHKVASSAPRRRPQPQTFDMLDDPDLQSEEIEDYLLARWRPE